LISRGEEPPERGDKEREEQHMPKKLKSRKTSKAGPKKTKPLPESVREPGVIAKVFIGKEGHGIETVQLSIEFKNGSSYNYVISLALSEEKHRNSFVRELCDTFAVTKPDQLEGLGCFALRCWEQYNTPIEGLESMDTSLKFTLSGWRKRLMPKQYALSPLENKRDSLKRELARLAERMKKTREELKGLNNAYFSWE
jgi:hypothetical protein